MTKPELTQDDLQALAAFFNVLPVAGACEAIEEAYMLRGVKSAAMRQNAATTTVKNALPAAHKLVDALIPKEDQR